MEKNRKGIGSKEELKESLKGYKDILSNEQYDYLNSLLALEFSVIRDYISENERIVLSDFEIYDRIFAYNIYNRTLSYFENSDKIRICDDSVLGVYNDLIPSIKGIFSITYHYKDNAKYRKINSINFYPVIQDNDVFEKTLSQYMNKLNDLEKENNPYRHVKNVLGYSSWSIWNRKHKEEIEAYKWKCIALAKRLKLNGIEQEIFETTNELIEKVMVDYGLNFDSFQDESTDISVNACLDNTFLEKTQTKIISGKNKVKIYNNIKYI